MSATRRLVTVGVTALSICSLDTTACREGEPPGASGGEAGVRGEGTGGAATAQLPDAGPMADDATGRLAITTGQPVVVAPGEPVAVRAGLTRVTQGPLAGGVAGRAARALVRNPYDGDPAAIQRGKYLFIHMNCAYCHGFDGGGGMGPNLADNYWRFGADDADLFKTLWDGRPQGMPAWRNALTQDDIWRVIAYIRTFRGTEPGQGGQASSGEGQSRTGTQQGDGGKGAQSAGNQTPTRTQREPMPHVNVYLP